MSNDLHDALLDKDSSRFWKTWKRKVCDSGHSLPTIEDCNDDETTANKFKDYFSEICTVNSLDSDKEITKCFQMRLTNYMTHCSSMYSDIDDELIGIAIGKLHAGKACGLDNLQTEHLTHSHPVVKQLLAALFNLMLRVGYVPSDFGRGLLIPIPKDSSSRGIMKVKQFRGITISPVISKIFEHCLLTLYGHFLYSSDRQFSFKKHLGCPHAIFTVRKVIDYFVANGSTVNVCCLDISSAF